MNWLKQLFRPETTLVETQDEVYPQGRERKYYWPNEVEKLQNLLEERERKIALLADQNKMLKKDVEDKAWAIDFQGSRIQYLQGINKRLTEELLEKQQFIKFRNEQNDGLQNIINKLEQAGENAMHAVEVYQRILKNHGLLAPDEKENEKTNL